jgi:hypothetical protein
MKKIIIIMTLFLTSMQSSTINIENLTANEQYEKGLKYHFDDINYEKAFKWYLKAAKRNHSASQNAIGSFYLNGLFVKEDKKKSFNWFMKSAKKGYPQAQFNISYFYFFEEYFGIDEDLGFDWLLKSANQGFFIAEYFMGMYYEIEDPEKSYNWYLKAANQSHSISQYKIGMLYSKGEKVKKDLIKSKYWFLKSSNLGNSDAQYQLGLIYLLKEDYINSCFFFLLSSKFGNLETSKYINVLEENISVSDFNTNSQLKYEKILKNNKLLKFQIKIKEFNKIPEKHRVSIGEMSKLTAKEMVKKISEESTQMLPQRINNNITLEKIIYFGENLFFIARYSYNKIQLENFLNNNKIGYNEMKKEVENYTINGVCSNYIIKYAISKGVILSYKYQFNNGEEYMEISISECKE